MRLVILALFASSLSAQVPVIFDDDCTADADCALNVLSGLFKLADRGEITILGAMADTANVQAAPALKVFATFYKRPTLTIGAWQGSLGCSNGCNTSAWLSSLIGQYDAGDTRANYADCLTVYRTLLATNSNVTIIETGMMTCLNSLLQSPADGISSLTGAQLIQQRVSKIVVCCGVNPSGSENNFVADPPDTAAVFSTITSQNGYPPIWMIGFGNGTGTNAGPPQYGISTVYPALWVALHGGGNQRPIWDALCVLYAARGLSFGGTTYFSDAGNGTQVVNATTGANSWSTGTASGQHYLNNVASTTVLSQIFDGFSYGFGFAALPPGASAGVYTQAGVKVNGIVGRK